MKKRINICALCIIVSVVLVALFSLSACSGEKEAEEVSGEALGNEAQLEIPEGLEGSQSAAYFAIIKKVADLWEGTNMAIDLENVDVDKPEQLTEMLEAYCRNNNMKLIISDFDGLIEKGYIEVDERGLAQEFKDGFHITFNFATLSKEKLVVNAGCWYGNLGAEGGTFTARLKDGAWVVDEDVQNTWIS